MSRFLGLLSTIAFNDLVEFSSSVVNYLFGFTNPDNIKKTKLLVQIQIFIFRRNNNGRYEVGLPVQRG